MAEVGGPGKSEKSGRGLGEAEGSDLDKRRRDLDAALAARKPAKTEPEDGRRPGGMSGMGYALRLSSEFVAGIVVGALIGWVIDEVAGTTPWGLVVFLLLGFGAGVLNVLRASGRVAEFGAGSAGRAADETKRNDVR